MPAALLLYLLFLRNNRNQAPTVDQPLPFPTTRPASVPKAPRKSHTLSFNLLGVFVYLLIAVLLIFAAFVAASATFILASLSCHFLFVTTDYAQAIMTAIFSVLFAVILGLILFCMSIMVQSILPKHSR